MHADQYISTAPREAHYPFVFPLISKWRIACCVTAVLVCMSGGAVAEDQTAQPVGIVYAQRKAVAQSLEFVGRVEAIDRVIIQARVKGYLEQMLFKEGDTVKKGDHLYQIEKGLFEAAVEQAQGVLERDKAAKVLTEIELQRKQELVEKQAGTVVARDIAKSADDQAHATILSDEAALDTAKINLGYTDIRSPIDGRISRTSVTPGNVVGPETGQLTLIVSQNPMYVTFPVSQRDLLQAQLKGGYADIKGIKVKLRFANDTTYQEEGAVDFIDVSVNRSTDTVIARATITNPNSTLIDGQLVSVIVSAGQPQEKVVVPQGALIADQEGIYVFVVENGKAAVKRVKTAGESGPDVVIADGLKGGEEVVVEGLQSIRPGMPVLAKPLPTALNRS
jgi:membrane fusion protein, multidrug efflux system